MSSLAKPVVDRSLAVSSRKDLRTDLALKFARAELAGESALAQRTASMPAEVAKTSTLLPAGSGSFLNEIFSLQTKGFSPIIVVPSASSSRSRLTSLNVLKFLRDGEYEEPNTREMQRPNLPVELERTVGGKSLRFRIFDDTSRFRKEDWKSVVAVFTDGKMWQFSGWPFRTESDLFSSVQAFNLRYSEDQVESLVNSGRVKSLIVKRSARHQDSGVMVEFWKCVETFLNSPRTSRFSNSQKLP